MEKLFGFLSLAALVTLSVSQEFGAVNTTECALCDTIYTQWLRNRTRDSYWLSHDTTLDAGNHICNWTSEVYDCYMTCGRNSEGQETPNVDSRQPIALKNYENKYCLEGECRLADTQSCIFSGSSCDPITQECAASVLRENGCEEMKLCTAGERRVFAQNLLDNMDCYLGYPDSKVEGREFTMTEEQGLQQCKDIIIVECLGSWSDNQYDLSLITNYSNETKATFCSAQGEVMQCIAAVANGTVEYARHTYTAPCNPDLLKHPEHLDQVNQHISYVYERLCSDYDPCEEPLTTSTTSTTTPSITTTVALEQTTDEEVQTTVNVRDKKKGDDSKPQSPKDVHVTDAHDGHDHDHDHKDHNSAVTPVTSLSLVILTVGLVM